MTHIFFRYWDHHRLTAKAITTFLVSGIWHLTLLRTLLWEAVLQTELAFVMFGIAMAANMTLSYSWKTTHGTSITLYPWARWPLWGVKVTGTFAVIVLIHGFFLSGLAGMPLKDCVHMALGPRWPALPPGSPRSTP